MGGSHGLGLWGRAPSTPEAQKPLTGNSAEIITLDSLRSLPEGTGMAIRTVFAGDQLEDLQVRFVGVIDDMAPPCR